MLTRSRSPAKGVPSQSFLAAEAEDKENVKENMSPARERKGCLKTGAKQATLTTSPVTRSAMRRMQSPVQEKPAESIDREEEERQRRKKERRESLAKRRVSFGQDTIKLIPHNDDLHAGAKPSEMDLDGLSYSTEESIPATPLIVPTPMPVPVPTSKPDLEPAAQKQPADAMPPRPEMPRGAASTQELLQNILRRHSASRMSLSPARDLNGWRQSAGTASVAQSPIQKIVSLLGGRSTGSSSAEARDSLDRMREIEPLTPDMLQNADESIVDMDMTDTYGNIHSGAEVNSQRCPRAAELECSASSDTASPNVFKQLAGGYLSQGHNESVSESTERYAMSDQTCTFALLHSKPASEQPKMADTSLNETLGSDMEMTGTYGHILATTQHDANDSSMELTRCYGAGVTDGNHPARAEALVGTDESMEMTATYGKIVSTTPTAELHCTPTMEVEMEMTGTYGTILSDECSRRSMIPRPRPRAADISVRFELNESASSIGTSAEAVAVAEAEKFSVAELVEAFELSLPLEMPCRRRKSSLGAARLSASGPMASDEADHAAVLIGKVEVELLQQTAEALDKATDALKMDIEALGTMSLSDPMAAEVNSAPERLQEALAQMVKRKCRVEARRRWLAHKAVFESWRGAKLSEALHLLEADEAKLRRALAQRTQLRAADSAGNRLPAAQQPTKAEWEARAAQAEALVAAEQSSLARAREQKCADRERVEVLLRQEAKASAAASLGSVSSAKDELDLLEISLNLHATRLSTRQIKLVLFGRWELLLDIGVNKASCRSTLAPLPMNGNDEIAAALMRLAKVEEISAGIKTLADVHTAITSMQFRLGRIDSLLRELEAIETTTLLTKAVTPEGPRLKMEFANSESRVAFSVTFELDWSYPSRQLRFTFDRSFGRIGKRQVDETASSCARGFGWLSAVAVELRKLTE